MEEGVIRLGTELRAVRGREEMKGEKLEWASWLQCGRRRRNRKRTRKKEDVWEDCEEGVENGEEGENEMESRSTRILLLSVKVGWVEEGRKWMKELELELASWAMKGWESWASEAAGEVISRQPVQEFEEGRAREPVGSRLQRRWSLKAAHCH